MKEIEMRSAKINSVTKVVLIVLMLALCVSMLAACNDKDKEKAYDNENDPLVQLTTCSARSFPRQVPTTALWA